MRAVCLLATVLVSVLAAGRRTEGLQQPPLQAGLAYYAFGGGGGDGCGRADGCDPQGRERRASIGWRTEYRLEDDTYLGEDEGGLDVLRIDAPSGVGYAVGSAAAEAVGGGAGWAIGTAAGNAVAAATASSSSTAAMTWGTFAASAGPWAGLVLGAVFGAL
jgi:hypothetical protein